MKQIKVNAYLFDELGDEAQQNAIMNVDDGSPIPAICLLFRQRKILFLEDGTPISKYTYWSV